MDQKNYYEKIEIDNPLGDGYEPMAVCLMVLFLWIFFVSFVSRFFM